MGRHLPFFTSSLAWIGVFCLQEVTTTDAFVSHPSSVNRLPGKLQMPITVLFQTDETSTSLITTRGAVFHKSSSEEIFIRDILQTNAIFKSLQEESLLAIIDAFEKFNVTRNQVIVTQGDSCEGDYVYVIADGKCKIKVDGKTIPSPYGTIESGAIFGELGVLYDKTRGATIISQSKKTTLFRIQGEVFKTILDTPTDDLAKMQEIDDVINQVSGSMAIYDGDIIPKYKPERIWLWRQLAGTVINISLKTTLGNCLSCLVFIVLVQQSTGVADYHHPTQFFWTTDGVILPDKELPLVRNLSLVGKIWGYQRTLTTFVLTFFVNRAFGFWQNVYSDCRRIQNSLDGYFLILSTNVKRNDDGTLPPESVKLLDDVGQYSRLCHALYWASTAQRFQVLQTPMGLQRMESRGMMTKSQLKVLQSLDVSDDQLKLAPLEWMLIRPIQAMDEGIMAGDTATKGMCLKQMGKLRDSYMAIPNKLAGRMPLGESF